MLPAQKDAVHLQVVSTENYSELQKGRIDYVPPQPNVLKGELPLKSI